MLLRTLSDWAELELRMTAERSRYTHLKQVMYQ